jgi:hypothetical protein
MLARIEPRKRKEYGETGTKNGETASVKHVLLKPETSHNSK